MLVGQFPSDSTGSQVKFSDDIAVQRSNFQKFIIFLILVGRRRKSGEPGGRAEGRVGQKGKFLLPFRNARFFTGFIQTYA